MARFVLIFSILIGLGAGFLGWKTKEQADALQQTLSTTKSNLSATKATLKKTEDTLTETKATLETTQAKLTQTEMELTNAKGELANTKEELAKVKADVEDKTAKIAAVESKMKEIMAKIPGGSIEDIALLPAKLEELSAAKTKLETELAEAKQVQETLKQKSDGLETEVAAKTQTIQDYKFGAVKNGLSGKVLAYNPGWNFVVLSIGDKAGLKAGAQMVITRAGAMIGKVKVTTVEPNQSIADVLPGTMSRGEAVQPGDAVIYEGKR